MRDIEHAPPMPSRIFIDATYTITSGRNSGIERVVRRLWDGTQVVAAAQGLPIPQLIINHNGNFYPADSSFIAQAASLGQRHRNILATTPRLYRLLASAMCHMTASQQLRKLLLPQAGHLGVFKLGHSLRQAAFLRRYTRKSQPLRAHVGDLLFLPDAYWSHRLQKSVWPAAAAARQSGAFVCTMLYDLIPLTHPEFVGAKRRDAFLNYVTQAATNSDMLLAISKTVCDQVREFLPTIATSDDRFCSDIRSFQLGAELGGAQAVDSQDVRPHVQHAMGGPLSPYLMVATFDPRKNHPYLLDAFDRLWDAGHDVRLCLVGRIGARCDELVDRIRLHRELGQRLFLFEDLSDAELHFCYQHARGVIFPSIVEGYGLPIVESLWFRKRTFVSDTPIHREVGGGDCSYFDLSQVETLVQQVVQWEATLDSGREIDLPTRRPTTWRESSQQALSACLHAMRPRMGEQRAA
ncbi:MAG: glycosyltransferase family 1 protein [Pirellulaceae bacterium]